MTATTEYDCPIVVTLRCRAFSCEGVRENRLRVKSDTDVRVWDSVAGHYVVPLSLSKAATARAIRDAKRLRAGKIDESATCYFDR